MVGSKIHLFDEKNNCIDYAYSKYIDDNGDTIHHLWTTNSKAWTDNYKNQLLLTIREDGNGLCLPKMGGYADYHQSYIFMLLTSIALGDLPAGLRPLVDTYII